MPKYTYQPLDKPASEFRLLQISKDPLTHQPQCSLQKYSLVDCPRYTALSYTWGEPTPTRSVAIDRANLEVRQNLFDFLRAYTIETWGMYDATRPVFFWIDQICINQEDLAERSDQVRIMNKIYKQAKSVLVWLGSDPKMIEAAYSLQKREDRSWTLATLTSHPYFSRIWVIQEIALGVDPPLIVCGGRELDWAPVYWAAMNSQNSFSLGAKAMISVRGHYYRARRTLEHLIFSHCRSNCHDPRDKVYGLLGLTPERWRVHVDYTKEVLEVYFDAVAALCEELFDLGDPECLYPKRVADTASRSAYYYTLVILGEEMGLSQQHLRGLRTFLRHCLDVYMDTKIRNVHFIYTGRTYTTVRAHSSSGQALPSEEEEEEEIEVSWGSITATRRNPLMRDIIPGMGLQLAGTTAESTVVTSDDSVPVLDRWWCKHNGEVHYFDCFDESSDESSFGSFDDSLDDSFSDGSADGSADGLGDGLDEEYVCNE